MDIQILKTILLKPEHFRIKSWNNEIDLCIKLYHRKLQKNFPMLKLIIYFSHLRTLLCVSIMY